jgi:hypothetical protein
LAPDHSDQHNEENMDASPEQEEMGQAIYKFLLQLEKQERQGFKDLHIVQVAEAYTRVRSLHVSDRG